MTTAIPTGHAAISATLGVEVRRGLACPAPDGTVLRTDVHVPPGTGPFPVLLQRTPHDHRHGQSDVGYAPRPGSRPRATSSPSRTAACASGPRAGSPRAREGQRLAIGPWVHGPWAPHASGGGLAPGSGEIDDAHLVSLREVLAAGPATAPVRVVVVGEGRREMDDWPPPAGRPQPWFLHSGGRAAAAWGDGVLDRAPAGTEPADVVTYDPSVPVPSAGGHAGCVPGRTPMGPADQAGLESQKNVLVHTSPPLGGDLVLIGEVTVRLFAATDAPDTDWTARLCQVDPAGASASLQEGIVRAAHVLGRPPRSGVIEAYEIPLGPVGLRIPAGHRLRLDVASSDFPQWSATSTPRERPELGGAADGTVATQVVAHDATRPSCVVLPVVPDP